MFDDVAFDTNSLIIEGAMGAKNVTKPNQLKLNDKTKISVGEYNKLCQETIPAVVISFSGALDNQTAADVNDASSFELKPVTGPEKAGGATTNSLHAVLAKNIPNLTYSTLLVEMHHLLKAKKYSQVPSLSTSHQMNLAKKQFSLNNPHGASMPNGGRKRALIIGINYYDLAMELSGCLNDCKMQIRWLEQQGWPVKDPSCVRIINDKRDNDDSIRCDMKPTGENIVNSMSWLVSGCQAGDSLFFHYSGHGSQLPEVPDEKGVFHEDDHMDETMVPLDYKTKGQIRDDTIFKLLVPPLKQGVQLLCFFDCCHSSSVMDLQNIFTVDNINLARLEKVEEKKHQQEAAMVQQASHDGTQPSAEVDDNAIYMDANPEFNFDFAKKLLKQVYEGGFEGLPEVFNTLFVGDAARARSLKLQQCCFGLCFGGEANLTQRRAEKRAQLEKEKAEKEQQQKNGGAAATTS